MGMATVAEIWSHIWFIISLASDSVFIDDAGDDDVDDEDAKDYDNVGNNDAKVDDGDDHDDHHYFSAAWPIRCLAITWRMAASSLSNKSKLP